MSVKILQVSFRIATVCIKRVSGERWLSLVIIFTHKLLYEYRCSSSEACKARRTGLCDGERLLLHRLVQNGARRLAHLVELVDAAHAVVAEHQRARLQRELLRVRVLREVRRQANGARALPGRVLAARHQVVHVLQQLRLARRRVAAQQNIDVAPPVRARPARTRQLFAAPAEQLEQNACVRVQSYCC